MRAAGNICVRVFNGESLGNRGQIELGKNKTNTTLVSAYRSLQQISIGTCNQKIFETSFRALGFGPNERPGHSVELFILASAYYSAHQHESPKY